MAGIDDRSVQKVLGEVDSSVLAVALTGADSDVYWAVTRNLSPRAATLLQEEIDYHGPTTQKQRVHAQDQIVAIIRTLRNAGEIELGGRAAGLQEI